MTKKENATKKVQCSIELPHAAWDLIYELARSKPSLYGNSVTEVAQSLILDQLKVIARDRLLSRQ